MKVFYFAKVKLGPSKSVKIQVLDKLKLSSTLEVNFKNLQVEIYNVHSHCVFDACLDCQIIEEKSILSFSEQRWWYDKKNNCLNDQQKGMYLGKLSAKDHILQIYNTGKVVIENFYPELIFYDDIKYVSKVKRGDLFFVVYLMKAEKQFFLKRFVFDSQPISENLFISENEFKIHNLLFEKDAIMEISYIDDKSKKIRKQECDLRSFFKVDTDYEKELRLPFKNILSLEKIIK